MASATWTTQPAALEDLFIVFLVGVGVATTLIWPPVFNTLASVIAGRH